MFFLIDIFTMVTCLQPTDPLPEFDAEFYIMTSDWFNKSSFDLALLVQGEAVS